MTLSIRHFGRPSRDVVGIHQAGKNNMPPGPGFLLCRPFGQEASRTAPVFRVVADRLSREGCESLRFDYHGTGDSPGEEQAQGLAGWVDDLLAAHEQLGGQSQPVNWFGMGLGATLALRAALRVKSPPAHLILWEPVLDGATYTNTLLDVHRSELAREFGEPWQRLLRLGRVVEPELPGDVLGFDVGPQLADDLSQLRDVTLAPALRRGIKVICAVHPEQRQQFVALAQNPLLKLNTIQNRTNWMVSQALGTAIVPPDLLSTILSALDK